MQEEGPGAGGIPDVGHKEETLRPCAGQPAAPNVSPDGSRGPEVSGPGAATVLASRKYRLSGSCHLAAALPPSAAEPKVINENYHER